MHGVKESSRLLAALSTGEEDSGNILEASRSLANALKALLGAAQPEGKVTILYIMSSYILASYAGFLLGIHSISDQNLGFRKE